MAWNIELDKTKQNCHHHQMQLDFWKGSDCHSDQVWSRPWAADRNTGGGEDWDEDDCILYRRKQHWVSVQGAPRSPGKHHFGQVQQDKEEHSEEDVPQLREGAFHQNGTASVQTWPCLGWTWPCLGWRQPSTWPGLELPPNQTWKCWILRTNQFVGTQKKLNEIVNRCDCK